MSLGARGSYYDSRKRRLHEPGASGGTARAGPCGILTPNREALATRAQIFRLFLELKRRKVFRIIAGYAVASFVIIQIADIIVPALDGPEHGVRWVLGVLIAGLPIALALSWRYDLSPEGLKFTGALEDENGKIGSAHV